MGTRTVTGTIDKPDGTAYASATVRFTLVDPFETATEYYPATDHTETTDAQGQFSTALGVPDTGTAHYRITVPENKWYEFYLASGAAVDLVTLITIAGTAVSQDDLQTLLDAAEIFTITNVTSTYQMLVTDEYIRADGTFAITFVPAILTQPGVLIRNIGTGLITATRTGTDTIDGATTKIIYPGERLAFIVGATGKWES